MAVDFTPNEVLRNDSFGSTITDYPVSVSLHFNPDILGLYTLFFIGDPTSDIRSIGLQIFGDQRVSIFSYNSTLVRAFSVNTYITNSWQHLGGVWASDSSRTVYLNGVNEATNTDTRAYASPSPRISLGSLDRLSPATYFDGSMGELGIYNTSLVDEEMYRLGLGESPKTVRPQNLVWYSDLVREPYNDAVGGGQLTKVGSPVVVEHPRVIRPSYYSDTFYSFPAPPAAIGEVNAIINIKTPQTSFSEKYPSVGTTQKTPKVTIST